MDKMTNAYRLDFIFESTDEISDEDLIEMGIEVKESITSFLRSKRYTMQLIGSVDISTGLIREVNHE
jgi:hypothetical protein